MTGNNVKKSTKFFQALRIFAEHVQIFFLQAEAHNKRKLYTYIRKIKYFNQSISTPISK